MDVFDAKLLLGSHMLVEKKERGPFIGLLRTLDIGECSLDVVP